MAYHKVIGIDLGTTYSAVSVYDYDSGTFVVIPSAVGENTLPSVVGRDQDGKVIVGRLAQNNLVVDPLNTIIEIKRMMGVYERPPDSNSSLVEPARVDFLGKRMLPQEISAFILMELKRQAEEFLGEPIHDAVITVPAYFKVPQKGATEDAARIARLNVKRLLNEPTAAAVCFGADKATDNRRHTYAVYDLGGGTFDVSIIAVSEGNVTVVGTGGDPRLGGGDFDDRITDWVIEEIRQKHGVDFSQNDAIRARIKREAEKRKRELSAAQATWIDLPFLTPQLSANFQLTRAKFEELIADLLEKSLQCLDLAIDSAYEANGVEREEIEQVLLVGGSTRIPCIRTMLAEHMGFEEKDVRIDINPDEVVARGAAIVARDFQPSAGYGGPDIPIDTTAPSGANGTASKPIVLQDVTSHTLGFLEGRSNFVPIIPKESKLPAKQSLDGFTNGGSTDRVEVLIFQGEEPVAFNNTLIGKLPIPLPEVREQGYYQFEITFTLDNDGLLHVAVKELRSQKDWATQIQCAVRSDEKEIDKSAREVASSLASRPGLPTPANSARSKPFNSANLPKPPAGRPVPSAQPVQPVQPEPPAPPAVPKPPENTPEQFKSIVRRSYKQINQLPSSPERDALLAAYQTFVQAVETSSPDLIDLGDDLEDAYLETR